MTRRLQHGLHGEVAVHAPPERAEPVRRGRSAPGSAPRPPSSAAALGEVVFPDPFGPSSAATTPGAPSGSAPGDGDLAVLPGQDSSNTPAWRSLRTWSP